jgi:hypothetical protein
MTYAHANQANTNAARGNVSSENYRRNNAQ